MEDSDISTEANAFDLIDKLASRACSNCQSISSIIWHRQHKNSDDIWFCNFCQTKKRLSLTENIQNSSNVSTEVANGDEIGEETVNEESSNKAKSIKSKISHANKKRSKPKSRQFSHKPATRTSRQASTSSAVVNKLAATTRSKPRKHLRKPLNPEKSILQNASVSTSGLLWHNGILYSEGDIVSVVDEVDNHPYYARIRGLLKDQFSNKYAALTWMLPKTCANLDEPFEICNFACGPRDEKLYDINCLEFICHSTKKPTLHDEPKCRLDPTADDDLNPEKQFSAV